MFIKIARTLLCETFGPAIALCSTLIACSTGSTSTAEQQRNNQIRQDAAAGFTSGAFGALEGFMTCPPTDQSKCIANHALEKSESATVDAAKVAASQSQDQPAAAATSHVSAVSEQAAGTGATGQIQQQPAPVATEGAAAVRGEI